MNISDSFSFWFFCFELDVVSSIILIVFSVSDVFLHQYFYHLKIYCNSKAFSLKVFFQMLSHFGWDLFSPVSLEITWPHKRMDLPDTEKVFMQD